MPPERPILDRAWLIALGVLVIVEATLFAYVPAIQAGYIWDDNWLLYENPCMHASGGLQYFWFPRSKEDTPGRYNVPDYFPITYSSLWLEWRAWGNDPAGYHVTNVILHMLGSLLVWAVLARLKIPGAWLAGLLFALHPVNVASVAWISERKNVLSLMFYLLTILAWLKFDDTSSKGWYAGALGLFLATLLCKTSTVMLPAVLLGLAWWRHRRITGRDLLRTAPLFVMSAVLGVVTIFFQQGVTVTDVPRPEGALSRLAAAGWCVWFYLYKALVPVNLVMVYPRWDVDPAWAPAWVPLIALIACGAVFWRFRRSWGRPLLFVLAYYVVTLLPVLGVIDAYLMGYSLVADHWQHLSIIAFVALVAGLGWWAAVRLPQFRGTATALGVAVAATLGTLTWFQAHTYQNRKTLWKHNLPRNPDGHIVVSEWAGIRFKELRDDPPRLAEVAALYQRVIDLKPRNPLAYCNLGTTQFVMAEHERKRGNMSRANGLISLAYRNLSKSIEMEPEYHLSHYNFGKVLQALKRPAEAIEHFRETVRIRPANPGTQYELGVALLQAGRNEEGIVPLTESLRLSPKFDVAHEALGLAYFRLGKLTESAAQYRRVLEIRPDYVPAMISYGTVLAMGGQGQAAETYLSRAVGRAPNNFEAVKHLAMVRRDLGRAGEALPLFSRALRIRPNDADVMANLARIRACWPDAKLRNAAEAVRIAEQACQLSGRKHAGYLDTLAIAYAAAGRFADAVKVAEEALALAPGNSALVAAIRRHLELFKAGKPYIGR